MKYFRFIGILKSQIFSYLKLNKIIVHQPDCFDFYPSMACQEIGKIQENSIV